MDRIQEAYDWKRNDLGRYLRVEGVKKYDDEKL